MDESSDDYATLKQRLFGRIIFAVVVLAGLLATLVVFDFLNTPQPEQTKPSPRAGGKSPPGDKVVQPQPLMPEPIPAETTAKTEPQVAEVTALPAEKGTMTAVDDRPLTKQASGRHVLMRAVDPVPASQAPPQTVLRTEKPAVARPLALATQTPFGLQLGVFGDLANAEELRSRLERAGIHATIEARVHVGPFATKVEADAARAKLRELGIAEAVLFSMKGRKAP